MTAVGRVQDLTAQVRERATRGSSRFVVSRGLLPSLCCVLLAIKGVTALIIDSAAFGLSAVAMAALFYLAGRLLRRGAGPLLARLLPARVLAATCIGLATGGTGYLVVGQSAVGSVVFAIGALAGALLFYDREQVPVPQVVEPSPAARADPEVAAMIAEARAKLQRLRTARFRIWGAPEVTTRLDRISRWIERILALVEEDPGDLRRARKFIVVYLDGAREVAEKYVALQGKGQAAAFRPKMAALLDEMERVSAEQHAKLLQNDTLDLDVQIEVLGQRLKNEGVA